MIRSLLAEFSFLEYREEEMSFMFVWYNNANDRVTNNA